MTAEHVNRLVALRLRNLVAAVDERIPRSLWVQDALTDLADDLCSAVTRVNVSSRADAVARDGGQGHASVPSSAGDTFTGPTAFCFAYEHADIPAGMTLDQWRRRAA